MSFGYEHLLGVPCMGIAQSKEKSCLSIGNILKKMDWSQCQGAS